MADKSTKDASKQNEANASTPKSDSISQFLSPASDSVADLHVPQIIAALHQNAVDKCSGDLGDKFRITNSALDVDGNKPTLTSAGQHIISVIPTEKASADGEKVDKALAVKVLKTYVSWFVGPDLASKINDSTVQPLVEEDSKKDEKNKTEEKDKKEEEKGQEEQQKEADAKKNADEGSETGDSGQEENAGKTTDLKESSSGRYHKFMSFSQFLREADGDSKDAVKEGEEDAKNDEDKNDGWYVPYNLKIEGMKQTALKDAKKKFALTFFDDLTIKASGLFGGGDSFTVGDVKKAFRSTFGPIDPDQLVDNIEKRIEKKYKGSDTDYTVKIQDKTTLINDLGSVINGTQKKQIDSADYSVYIKIGRNDPKKDVFNPTIVADIVQSSITGLWKKFKNKITKNDVIYIPNYEDEHENTDRLRKIYNIVPEPDAIRSAIDKAKNASDAVKAVDKLIDKIFNGFEKDYKNVKRARACYDQWKAQKKAWDKAGDTPDKRTALTGNAKNDYFKDFESKYLDVFKKSEQKSLQESCGRHVSFVVTNKQISNMIVESIFGKSGMLHEEDADSATNSTDSIDIDKIKNDTFYYIASEGESIFGEGITVSESDVACIRAQDLANTFPYFNITNDDIKKNCGENFELAKNALCFTKYKKPGSKLNESSIKHAIMDILFEDEPSDDTTSKLTKVNTDALQDIMTGVLRKAKVEGTISFEVFRLKKASDLIKQTKTDDENKPKDQNDESTVNESAKKADVVSIIKKHMEANNWKIDNIIKNLKKYLNIHKTLNQDEKNAFKKKYIRPIKDDITKTTGDNKYSVKSILDAAESIKNDSSSKSSETSNNKDEADDKKNKSIEGLNDLYVAFFGANEYVKADSAKAEEIDVGDDDNQTQIDDLYIIPMPNLKYEDPEYSNTNL